MTDVVALLIGSVILAAVAVVAARIADSSDDSMRWEGGVAIGFSALILLGPLWIAQAVCTVLATLDDRGIAVGWLWVWLFVAPAIGASPPAVAVARRLKTLQPNPSRPPGLNVQFLVDQAWAGTAAEPDWELRRTPPLPDSWPPTPGGRVLWFCYAERASTPATIEVAAPWACVVLGSESAVPQVDRLSGHVETLGLQGIHPLPPEMMRIADPAHTTLVQAIHHGDPAGILSPSLHRWRALNSRIAAHPLVAVRLPPHLD